MTENETKTDARTWRLPIPPIDVMIDRWNNRCAIGALTRVQLGNQDAPLRRLLDDPIALDASAALADYLENVGVHHTVTRWNDKIAADGEAVAATMEKAAAAYEERV